MVVVLLVALLGMASYIAWMNSADPAYRKGYLAYYLGSGNSEAELLESTIPSDIPSDSLAAWENSLLSANQLGTDSTAQDWKSLSELTNEATGTDTVSNQSFQSLPTQTTPKEPVQTDNFVAPKPVLAYYIKAGEFESRSSALFRIKELRQGNYKAKIIEPDSAGGTFVVSAGEFSSYKRALDQAQAIGFIMDIRTSVIKRE
ncbi:SPOR domain-containing protein [Salmonirosea aquatica]|uniref:SPOR domain-containing protein n=1 Tax=Salmonirosea aquatica TaxID=2654236 RepID=UPI0035715A89